jgi:hypothetical protein
MYALNSSLVRVKRKSPCPICGKPDWCSMTDDKAIVICMRVAEGSIKESKNFGYIHILEEREYRPLDPTPRKPEPPARAPLERRDAVYREMLATLTLTDLHVEDLRERGLSTLTIERNAYASLPALSQIPDLCADLAREHNLANVPGFYRDEEGRWMMTVYSPGFFIPVRDTQGRIQGCQIRQDHGSRYIWFSSPEDKDGKRKDGASSGAPIHFARPWRADATGEAIVTEGGLKADVIAELLDACVVGVPGVSALGVHFGAELKARLPEITTVFVAYDTDWRAKSQVATALQRLFDSLVGVGLDVVALDWNDAKGLDDFLVKEVGQ